MSRFSRCALRATAFALIFALSGLPGLANVDPKKGRVTTNPTKGNSYTIEQEIDYGRKAIPEIEKQLPLLPADQAASKYIDSLGHKLAAKAPGYQFPYTFKVVRQKEINAFAVPGGPIYINMGTIEAGSEAEVAGVLGHEIAHVVMRHSTRQASRQAKASIPLAILGGALGMGVGGWAGSLAQMGISIGSGGLFTKYSRDAETEADMVGAQIIYDAGYDPYAMVTFFHKLKEKQGGRKGPSFLASHPDPGNRAKNVASILSRFPPKDYQQGDSPEFVAAKNALSNVGPGKPGQNLTAAAAALHRLPTDELVGEKFTTYEHGAFRVSYPSNWQVKGERDTALTLYPPGGASAESVAYGAILSGFTPKSSGKDLNGATGELVASIQETNPGLQVQGDFVDITVSGRPAKRVELQGNSSIQENGKPIPERIRLVAVRGRNNLIQYMLFIAPAADFEALVPAFERMMQSFVLRE